MEDIYYLIHTTNNPDCINWNELRTAMFNTDDQFPGVYLSIITKNNINSEYIYSGKYIIILSKKLLLQNNYHINFTDYNGIISEKNTYFSWDLDKFISKSNDLSRENQLRSEVVFHDNISMKYCCGIIGIYKKPSNIKLNNFLPNMPMENEEEPDINTKPFVCYPFEDIYSGSDPLPNSSNRWYKMMSKVCKININPNNTRNDIIENIKDKARELYTNRDEQDITLLKEYTSSISGGKNNKSKTKRKNKQNTFRKVNLFYKRHFTPLKI